MVVELSRGDFIRGIKTAMSCVSKKSNTPILKTVYIEGMQGNTVSFSGNSTDIGVIMDIPGTVLESGSICADGEMISKIANLLPNDKNAVTLKVENGSGVLNIICGKVKQTIPVFDGVEFIKVNGGQDESEGMELETDEAVFIDCLKAVRPFLGEQQIGRVSTKSMLLKASGSTLSYMGLDGFRLCYITSEALPPGTQVEAQAPIPTEHVSNLIRMLDGRIGSDFRIVFFPNASRLVIKKKTSDEEIYIRVSLYAEQFGDFTGLIPKQFACALKFNKEELRGAVTRAGSFIPPGKKNAVVLEVNENGVANIGITSEVGNYSEDISVDSVDGAFKPIKLGMNPKFMTDMLGSYVADDIIINFNDRKSPMVSFLDAGTAKLSFLLLPVNI